MNINEKSTRLEYLGLNYNALYSRVLSHFLQHQYLTLMSLEVHVVTRENLRPDPQYDPIVALFYAIYNDIPTDASEQIEHGNYQS